FQTVHQGALAFLVVISSASGSSESLPNQQGNACSSTKTSVFTRRRSGVRIAPGPPFFEYRRRNELITQMILVCRSKVKR
ncbi:MAG: hypothetical protein ACXVIX_10900, partial [Halobacteriota archaeon]